MGEICFYELDREVNKRDDILIFGVYILEVEEINKCKGN